jgi:hypothetical protein
VFGTAAIYPLAAVVNRHCNRHRGRGRRDQRRFAARATGYGPVMTNETERQRDDVPTDGRPTIVTRDEPTIVTRDEPTMVARDEHPTVVETTTRPPVDQPVERVERPVEARVEERTMSVSSFIIGFVTAVVLGAIGLVIFLAVSDADDDGEIQLDVPAVDVEIDG